MFSWPGLFIFILFRWETICRLSPHVEVKSCCGLVRSTEEEEEEEERKKVLAIRLKLGYVLVLLPLLSQRSQSESINWDLTEIAPLLA